MKKVLILSYFFPPCNLTASQRALGWAKYLKKFGYYPVIITRNWDNPISVPTDVLMQSGSEVKHLVTDEYEVYYLPYKGSLRDRFFVTYGETRFRLVRRLLTFIEIFFENFSNYFIPYSNLYDFARDYIKKDGNVERIVVTANPFTMFRFGYLLKKEFKIKWLADYRDDWNTSEFAKRNTLFQRIINIFSTRSERRWVKSAECITSVSDAYQDKISRFVKRDGHVLLNGYFAEEFEGLNMTTDNIFTVIYNGSLYQSQEIEVFLDAFKRLIDEKGRDKIKTQIIFPGLLFDKKQADRVLNYLIDYQEFVKVTTRIPKRAVLEMQAKAHVFLMVAHNGMIGIPSSKLYEYIGFGKPIIAVPTDHDIIENTLKDYNLACVCENPTQTYEKLLTLYNLFETGQYHTLVADKNYQHKYTREHSAQRLAEILDAFYLPEEVRNMPKAVILAHDFPPYTSIGALRPYSWLNYLKESGVYPIVVTRRWDHAKYTAVDVVKPSLRDLISVYHTDKGTEVRVPYRPNLRDQLIIKYGMEKFSFLRRTLTLYYSIMKFICRSADNTDIIYSQAKRIIRDNGADIVIATGEPFILFKYGHKLANDFNIKWIADYRDGWTTNSVNIPKGFVEKTINNFFATREQLYLSNTSIITNASPTYAKDFIERYPEKNVKVVFNGFDDIDLSVYDKIEQSHTTFQITYAGILYPYHQLEMFLEGYKNFIQQSGCVDTRLTFLGIEFYPEQRDRILNYDSSLHKYIITTPRIPHDEVLIELRKANILLLLSDENAKSLHAKIFEYMQSHRKIMLVKNDKGVLQSILKECNAGVALSTAEEVTAELLRSYEEFKQKGIVEQHTVNLEKYSRRYQAKVLADLILER